MTHHSPDTLRELLRRLEIAIERAEMRLDRSIDLGNEARIRGNEAVLDELRRTLENVEAALAAAATPVETRRRA